MRSNAQVRPGRMEILRGVFALGDWADRWLPGQCPFCHVWPTWRMPAGICEACLVRQSRTALRCPRCALVLTAENPRCPSCVRLPSPLAHCVAAVDYAYPWQQPIASFKYGSAPFWARAFAAIMLRDPQAHQLLQAADWIVPMPLSTERMRQRGYNQAWELACALARRSGRRHIACARLLAREGDGAAQTGATRKARLKNIAAAMCINPANAQAALRITGRHILLVDDVMTTGASLYAAARVLRLAGAASVSALVFARTDLPE